MKPNVTLHAGDNRASLADLPECSIDAVVTDPPYSLTSITNRFGKEGAAAARTEGNDGSFRRLSGGFMGKAWDATGIERDPAFWAAVYRVLKPGACVFAFAGARTGHWQACAMEQAGFIMHPMHAWLYGQGFPKGHDASKAIDKILGTTDQREVVGTRYEAKRFAPGATVVKEGGYRKRVDEDGNEQTFAATDELGGSPEARQWDGWKYGTQTQKPAMEPIYLAQKPYSEKTGAANLLKHGVGAFNVDGCRVPAEGRPLRVGDYKETNNSTYSGRMDGSLAGGSAAAGVTDIGRYPANVLHDGSDEAISLFPQSAGQLAKESSSSSSRKDQNVYGAMARGSAGRDPRGDAGSAARFFNSFAWCPDDEEAYSELVDMGLIDDLRWVPIAFYHAKAGKVDRASSKHPTVKPIGLLRHLVRHICPPGGTILDPFAGSGTTAVAAQLEGANCILMEAEPEYVEFLRKRFNLSDPNRNKATLTRIRLNLDPREQLGDLW